MFDLILDFHISLDLVPPVLLLYSALLMKNHNVKKQTIYLLSAKIFETQFNWTGFSILRHTWF